MCIIVLAEALERNLTVQLSSQDSTARSKRTTSLVINFASYNVKANWTLKQNLVTTKSSYSTIESEIIHFLFVPPIMFCNSSVPRKGQTQVLSCLDGSCFKVPIP